MEAPRPAEPGGRGIMNGKRKRRRRKRRRRKRRRRKRRRRKRRRKKKRKKKTRMGRMVKSKDP